MPSPADLARSQDIIVTPSELVSDSFKLEKKGDCVYEVDCKSITKTDQNDFGESLALAHEKGCLVPLICSTS